MTAGASPGPTLQRQDTIPVPKARRLNELIAEESLAPQVPFEEPTSIRNSVTISWWEGQFSPAKVNPSDKAGAISSNSVPGERCAKPKSEVLIGP
jgi:hypothetical protein